MDEVGLRKACAWIGNTPTMAMKHYRLLKDTDYLDEGDSIGSKSGAVMARIPTPATQKTQ